ncbi:MAG: hypothetical protein ABFC89_13240 [Methanospirillum sp.]
MADVSRKTQETRESAMAGQSTKPTETTMRGSSSQQTGGQMGRETTTRGSSRMQAQEGMQGGMTRGSSEYAKSLCEREHAMGERERGMSERERGMSDRERAMYDRECAMTDRERSSAWGGESREGESPAGGMSSGQTRTQSRTGGQSGASQTGTTR